MGWELAGYCSQYGRWEWARECPHPLLFTFYGKRSFFNNVYDVVPSEHRRMLTILETVRKHAGDTAKLQAYVGDNSAFLASLPREHQYLEAIAIGYLADALISENQYVRALAILERVPLRSRAMSAAQKRCLGLRAIALACSGQIAKARKDRERLWAHDPSNKLLERIDRVLDGRDRDPGPVAPLDGARFEQHCSRLFEAQGYRVEQTQSTRDGGFDLLLMKDGRVVPVECKHHQKPVGVKVIRELIGVMNSMGASRAIVCASSGFTEPAVIEASGSGVELLAVDFNDERTA